MRWLVRILVSLLVLFVAIVVASVIWLWVSFPTVSYRYRLTVAVETHGQIHSGSSVIEVRTQFWPELFRGLVGGSPGHISVQGQAVLIDLGARGALVAALGGAAYGYCTVDAEYLVGRAYEPAGERRRCVSGYVLSIENERALSQKQGPVELTPDNLPAFIWFSDKTDPTSVRLVKPDDFAVVIGDAARLTSAQIEITHDPIVIDIDKRLPLYKKLPPPPRVAPLNLPNGVVLDWAMFIAPGSVQ